LGKPRFNASAGMADGFDDGADPRVVHDRRRRHARKNHRKGSQLCTQVGRALGHALAASPHDALREALGVEVRGTAGGCVHAQLLLAGPFDEELLAAAQMALANAGPALRAEVAAALTRKHAPTIAWGFAFPHAAPPAAE
jgi:hypothetical protein